jgi:hypothetical protein
MRHISYISSPVNRASFGVVIIFFAAIVALPVAVVGAQDATPAPMLNGDPGAPCSEGRLQVQDLSVADESLKRGVEAAAEKAKQWQPDARLVELRLGCPLLETGFLWHGEFYSDSAQAFINTDTGEIAPAESDPKAIPTLVADRLSFQLVHRSLLRAGKAEGLELMPGGGVSVRTSTEDTPFGPTSAPRDRVYFHVALLERNEVQDIWIDAADGTIYRFETS